MAPKTIRCTHCAAEFTDQELEGATDKTGCPVCHTLGTPCHIKDDVTIRINWHELRVLGMWADNWARRHCDGDSQSLVGNILGRIQIQYPEQSPLTLLGEIRQLQETFPSAELYDGEGNILVPKKKVQ